VEGKKEGRREKKIPYLQQDIKKHNKGRISILKDGKQTAV
jgi:hypothetical protein